MGAAGGFIQAGSEMWSAEQQREALSQQGRYQERLGATNKKFADAAAEDVERAGDDNANRIAREKRKIEGAQRAAMGSGAMDASAGSAAALQAESRAAAENDMITARTNAWREAWGIKVKGEQSAADGRMARMTNSQMADRTVMAGGMNATAKGLNAYDDYRYPRSK
jgi:hypothetical protein